MLRKGVVSIAAAACFAAAMLPGAALAQHRGHSGGGSVHVGTTSQTGSSGSMHVNTVRSEPIHTGAIYTRAIHTGPMHVNRSVAYRTAHFTEGRRVFVRHHHRAFVRPHFRHHHRVFVRTAVIYHRSCWRSVYFHHHWHRVWVCRHHGWWWRHHHRHWY